MQTDGEKKEKRRSGRRVGGISRPFVIAIALVLAGAAFLFWPRGGGRPGGIGDQYSVVTAASQQPDGVTEGPRSGDVSIEDEVSELVPEKKASAETSAPAKQPPPAEKKQATAVNGSTSKNTAKQEDSAPKKVSQAEPSPPSAPTGPQPLQPQSSGGWALQVGAFTSPENAQKRMETLAEVGFAPILQTSNTADSKMLYRVWVGYFQTRQDAQTYAKQNRKHLGDGLPVHR